MSIPVDRVLLKLDEYRGLLRQAAETVRSGAKPDESNEVAYAHAIIMLAGHLDTACVLYFEQTEFARDTRGKCDEDETMDILHGIACEAAK
jgi:hypothetical protein